MLLADCLTKSVMCLASAVKDSTYYVKEQSCFALNVEIHVVGFADNCCRAAIGRQRSMRCTESFRIPRAGQFIGCTASGMKDCIMVIHRRPSVFGGQVNEYYLLLVQFLCYYNSHY